MSHRIGLAVRACANCRTRIGDDALLCAACHREAVGRKLRVLDLVAENPEVSLDELIETSGLSAMDIVNIAGDAKTLWQPPADDRIPTCVVCSAPVGTRGVCNKCTRRLEGRAAFVSGRR
jgi:predicted amidophosphoribosyltransferase